MAQTRLGNGTNQARKKHEPGSKPARKILQFVSFRLEAGHAKWLEPRHDRIKDVTQMTGNSVCKALVSAAFESPTSSTEEQKRRNGAATVTGL